MSDIEKIQLFEDQKVRTIWVESDEKWYFSIKDVILILAEAKDPKDYLSKMRRREPELAKGWGQIVHPLVVRTPGGPQKENFANLEGMFRIIQSIPSKKAEPFKRWVNWSNRAYSAVSAFGMTMDDSGFLEASFDLLRLSENMRLKKDIIDNAKEY